MKTLTIAFATAAMLGLAGCSNMNQTEQRIVSGVAIGAAVGTGVGAVAGGIGLLEGAAIGAGVGGLTGWIVDETQD